MRRLETQADGRRFAVDVLRALREAGPEKCRANLPPRCMLQADALMRALVEIKERATVAAAVGFGQILTDAIGTRALEPAPELYEHMERTSQFSRYRLRKLLNRGQWIAAPAVEREAIEAAEGNRTPGPAKGRVVLTAQRVAPPDREPHCGKT